jgi:hypothetical protein
MDLKFPVDSYDLKARYAPALIVSLPVLITLWTCFYSETQHISKLVSGILSAAILYFMSVLVRSYGKKFEKELWKSWGGSPSTQLVLWNNKRIGEGLKAKYHECVQKESGLPMPTKEQEESDPKQAESMIDDAFKRVKGVIRKHDKNGLWSIANAEYGFARNLLGSRKLWIIITLVCLATSGACLWFSFSNIVLTGFVLLVLNLIGCIVFSQQVLPTYTKQVAFRYAEHAWESYCNIVESMARQ